MLVGGPGARVAAFVVYGVLVWWLAYRLRGSWRALVPPALGVLGVVLVAWFHLWLNEWSGGKIYLRVLQVILYPYGVLVGAVGFFIALIPVHHVGRRDGRCHVCGYDLRGRGPGQVVCPECGGRVLRPGEVGERVRRGERGRV